jgi:FtsH-binding integral membrane protein
MPQLELFWHGLNIFAQQHNQFGLLFIVALIIAALLWRWRPQDRKPLVATLLFLIIALFGLAISGILAALDIKSFAKGLYEVSVFASGMAAIRLFGLFLFRLILPLAVSTCCAFLKISPNSPDTAHG